MYRRKRIGPRTEPCGTPYKTADNPELLVDAPINVAPINVKFVTGELRSASLCYTSCLQGQKCGNTAPKTVKISYFGDTFAHQGSLVCTIFTKLSDFIRVHRELLSFNLVTFGSQTTKL